MIGATCGKCGRTVINRHLARGLCDACYFTHRARNIAYGRWETMYVDAQPTRDHIQAFRDLGIGFRRIAELTGLKKDVLRGVAVGREGRPPNVKVHQRTERRVLAVELPSPRDSYRIASPGALVDITGTKRRLRALMRHGYTQTYLCSLISDSKYGHTILWTGRTTHTAARIADRVADVFDQLEQVPGPSTRARNWAAKKNWPGPFDWDEDTIDDPTAQPQTGSSADSTTFVQRYQEYVELGYRDDRIIAQRMGVTVGSLERSLYRQGAQPQRVAS